MVTILATITFGPKLGMYAILGVILNGFMIDNIIAGLETKINVNIVATDAENIRKYIIENLVRGATIYNAEGAYTNSPKKVIVAVMSKREFIQLKKYVAEIDPSAFVTANVVHSVLGEGFIR